ncbi:3'-5' exonuclease [Aidingimonas halophila]|uniref:DNA polymerase-3 subunit epsilon n=1 Tax=Aidingimonas halophila TaxID=574349 RepID=A0A1H2UMT0_9GAMM|nr:3'-5' exonuclease [Aidingimonas halophila]GHC22892.1 3'-5' exonuclease [Aidingimonas halophila]SDW57456.1 DNA polymerase-3 subunit epsilon [Aidingimonas halophila]
MLRTLRRAADRRRQAGGDYGWLFNPYTGDELVAIDCETTGLDPRRAELVSIAAVTVRGERVITSESLDLRLQCPTSLDGDSIRIHGLRGVDLDGGESVGDALARLLDFIGNRPLLGWCIDYDVTVINRQLRPRFGFDLPNALIDISHRYARELRRKHPDIDPDRGFESMARMLDVPVMGRHTALGDAVTTALMYLRLQRRALDVG